jgi:phosphoglucosamine mutase
MKLFGTDGIRGSAGEFPLDEKTINKIGEESVGVLKLDSADRVVIMGHDTRKSSTWIAELLSGAMARCGVKVRNAGVIPTPGVAYLTAKHKALAGAVISASHNPFNDNGIKFFSSRGTKLADETEKNIELGIDKNTGTPAAGVAKPDIKDSPQLFSEYEKFLKSTFDIKGGLKGLKLVVDCANGAAYKAAPQVLSSLGAEVMAININPDGENINHNCGAMYPEGLAEEVKKNRAFCGMAFDGDGDRVIFVDGEGVVRDGDYFLAICAKFLKDAGKLKNNVLVTTVMANLGLFKAMEREGIDVVKTPVGDKYVYEGLVARDGVIGGEQSGHIIFKKYLSTGDGILSALQMLSILRSTGKTLGELSGIMKKFPQVLINTKVRKKIPVERLKATSALVKDIEGRLGNDGRVLVRYSGTENLLRVMLEGPDRDMIAAMADEISNSAVNEIESA